MTITNTKSNSDILCSPRNGHLNSHLCFGSIYGIKKRNKRKEKKNVPGSKSQRFSCCIGLKEELLGTVMHSTTIFANSPNASI